MAVAPVLILVGGALVLMLVVVVRAEPQATLPYTVATCVIGLAAIGATIPLWREVQDADRGPVHHPGRARWASTGSRRSSRS